MSYQADPFTPVDADQFLRVQGQGTTEKPKVFAWIASNPHGLPDWFQARAIAEDGTDLGSHIVTHRSLGPAAMGVTSHCRHELYASHYPAGFEVLWVSHPDEHMGLLGALNRRNLRRSHVQA